MHLHLVVHRTECNLCMLKQCARSLTLRWARAIFAAAAVEAAEAVLVRRGVDACRSVAPRCRIPGRSLPFEAGRPRTARNARARPLRDGHEGHSSDGLWNSGSFGSVKFGLALVAKKGMVWLSEGASGHSELPLGSWWLRYAPVGAHSVSALWVPHRPKNELESTGIDHRPARSRYT